MSLYPRSSNFRYGIQHEVRWPEFPKPEKQNHRKDIIIGVNPRQDDYKKAKWWMQVQYLHEI